MKHIDNLAETEKPGRALEGIIGAAIGAQEIQRCHAVANQAVPEINGGLERWYWKHSGDLFQGYAIAFCIDTAAEYIAGKAMCYAGQKYGTGSWLYQAAEKLQTHQLERGIAAAAISSGVVALAEIFGILNVPEKWDIPAGIAGALIYLGTRAYVISRHNKIHESEG